MPSKNERRFLIINPSGSQTEMTASDLEDAIKGGLSLSEHYVTTDETDAAKAIRTRQLHTEITGHLQQMNPQQLQAVITFIRNHSNGILLEVYDDSCHRYLPASRKA